MVYKIYPSCSTGQLSKLSMFSLGLRMERHFQGVAIFKGIYVLNCIFFTLLYTADEF